MTALPLATPKQQFWRDHIIQWCDSGLSQASYCRKHGLNQNSLSYHKLKKSVPTKKIAVKTSNFIRFPLPQALIVDKSLTLHLTNGMTLSGIDSNNISTVKHLALALS